MVKEDNELLFEWIAYHWTILPLRYLIVGSDQDNPQDPSDVLRRWDGGLLRAEILESHQFVGRHGPYRREKSTPEEDPHYHHHHFVYRQKAFITVCLERMKNLSKEEDTRLEWVAFLDTDEFLVYQPIMEDDKSNTSLPAPAKNTTEYQQRQRVTQILEQQQRWSDVTALDILQSVYSDSTATATTPSCLLMPRLRLNALETIQCGTAHYLSRDYHWLDLPSMSTLRYVQHNGWNNFALSKFGKVLLHLPSLSLSPLDPPPRNIHRPVPSCPIPAIYAQDSIFRIQHYTASWERYATRTLDPRRNCDKWKDMAAPTNSKNNNDNITFTTCQESMHMTDWVDKFVELIGHDQNRARYLLGVADTERLRDEAKQRLETCRMDPSG